MAASLFGGVVGAVLAIGADTYWRQPPADFESRLAALETRPRPVAVSDTSGLERRLSSLEVQAKGLADGVAAAKAAAEASGRQANEAVSRPLPAADTSQTRPDPAVGQAVERLGGRLDAVEAALKGMPGANVVTDLRSAIQAVRTQLEERQAADGARTQVLQASAAALEQRLAAGDQRMSGLAAELSKLPPSLMQTGLRLVVAGQISDSLRGGAPLGPALTAAERLGTDASALAPFRPYATQPPPGAAQLAAEFKPVADRIAADSQVPTGTIGDRLLRIADKIVTVRAIGDGSGKDVPGLVGQIEAALARGAVADAAAAFDRLPDAVKQQASSWGDRLKQRATADAAARRLGADALAALVAPTR